MIKETEINNLSDQLIILKKRSICFYRAVSRPNQLTVLLEYIDLFCYMQAYFCPMQPFIFLSPYQVLN